MKNRVVVVVMVVVLGVGIGRVEKRWCVVGWLVESGVVEDQD